MNRLIEENRDDLIRLCVKYRVRRLEVFGSSLTNRFDPRTRDLDFLVEFLPLQPGEYADAYFGYWRHCGSCLSGTSTF